MANITKKNREIFSFRINEFASIKEIEKIKLLMRQRKENTLTIRDQDYYYWKYFMSLDNDGFF